MLQLAGIIDDGADECCFLDEMMSFYSCPLEQDYEI